MQSIKVLFVCLGNICRSTIAQGIFEAKVKNLNISRYFNVDSAGTSAFHVGNSPDWRSISTLKKHNIEVNHKARQITKLDIANSDYILTMDHLNYEDVINLAEDKKVTSQRTLLLRSFDPTEKLNFDIPDPYYGLEYNFEEVFQICQRSVNGFIAFLNEQSLIHPYN